MRALILLAAAVLGVCASLLVACGDRSHLIPSGDANELDSALDQVAAATSAGDCATARQAVNRASAVLAKLPDSVDGRLRARLRSGVANLRERVPVQCAGAGGATTTETTPTQTTTTTPTQTTPTQTTPTTPTQTTPTTPSQTTPTTPSQTTPQGQGNGNGNSNGNANGNGSAGGAGAGGDGNGSAGGAGAGGDGNGSAGGAGAGGGGTGGASPGGNG
jgi:hypothetical protein